MKKFRLLLVLSTLLSPLATFAANITINSLPPQIADFHPVFIGGSSNASSFITNSGTSTAPFVVKVDELYNVNKLVNGVPVKIGTVSWNSSGVPTYTML